MKNNIKEFYFKEKNNDIYFFFRKKNEKKYNEWITECNNKEFNNNSSYKELLKFLLINDIDLLNISNNNVHLNLKIGDNNSLYEITINKNTYLQKIFIYIENDEVIYTSPFILLKREV